jgi:PAS domain S-box-containing protein
MQKTSLALQAIFEASPLAIVALDSKANVKMWNPAAEKIFGWTQQEVLDQPIPFVPEDKKREFLMLHERIMKGEPFTTEDVLRMRKDGSFIDVSISRAPLREANGDIFGAIGIIADTTERKRTERALQKTRDELEMRVEERTAELVKANEQLKQEMEERKLAEEALRQSEERFRDTADLLPTIICEMDNNLRITYVNKVGFETFGYTQVELDAGVNVLALIHPDDREKAAKRVQQMVKGTKLKPMEYRLLRKNRSEIAALLQSLPMHKDGQISGFRISMTDITEQKRIQAQLQEAQKAEAIATLAGGIAHEFNNSLVGITGNMELLKMDLLNHETVKKYIEPMMATTRRIAHLTNQLLAYAQGGKYRPKIIALNNFVEETLPLIQHDIDPRIRIETDLPRDISNIEADLTQMQMVLSALVNNSAEAMEGPGRIRILTRTERIDEESAKSNPELRPGLYVSLTIEDDGKGMDEETKNRVFDPFFTTKFQGRGLGMAAVYGIVKNHGGWVSVRSESGTGTVVQIYLPALQIQIKEDKKIETELVKSTGTILIIEDEEIVIDIISTMLERLGYRTLIAKSGTDAVNIAETFDGDIDLAILDIVLPDMDGRKIYPLIVRARPKLKVIVCSGYAIEGPAQEILNAGAQDFIQKPYSFAALSQKLEEISVSKPSNS